MVQGALEALMPGRTTLVIAHRLSTVRRATHICVIDEGVCVEEGTHEELMRRAGVYAALVARQIEGGAGGGSECGGRSICSVYF